MRFKFLLILFVSFQYYSFAQNSNPTIKIYQKTFTTYPFSDPDPIPKPDTKTYPYFRFDGFTDQPVQKQWKVIELENDYIKLMILPEIGGKIWSATEKSTGKDFIYNNHVIKFRDIAMRGPWTSGGLEANYGIIGHTPNCATPVDYTTIQKGDGSVSCVIGALDLLTRTSWRLDINLPKDKAYFTTNSFWFNATAYEQPYYTWMNTGIKAGNDLEFIYPGKNYLGHDGEFNNWPINLQNGKDLRFYKNNDFGGYKSYHVFGKYTDFFGAYWHDNQIGMGRYGNHDDKAGKKIWIWGLSNQGMIWEKLLTDTDGQYVEVQSGRLFNQSAENSMLTPFKHRSFAPYQSDAWTEYWFPVIKTKGFVQANNYGSVNVKKENGWLKIYFSPLQAMTENLVLYNNGKKIYEKSIEVKPLVLFVDSINTSVDYNTLSLVLGNNKLVWNAAPNAGDLNRPLAIPTDFNNNSVYGLYLQGKNCIAFKDYIKASEKLSACLKIDPNYLPALTDLSSVKIRSFDYQAALLFAKKALAINTYDPAANYYYAIANLYVGAITDAKDGFDIAASSVEFRSASYTELAKIYFKENNSIKAIEYAEKALLNNQTNLDALQLLVVINRIEHHYLKASSLLNKIHSIDPINHFVDFEKLLIDSTSNNKNTFLHDFNNEIPSESFLELAIWYCQINQNDIALKLLLLSTASEEVGYWINYLRHEKFVPKHIVNSTNFSFRYETAQILQEQILTNTHWELKYQLGLIEWNRNNVDKAIALLMACGNEPLDPAFYAARAALMNNQTTQVELDLHKSISLDKNQWRYPKLLAEHFIRIKNPAKALAIIKPYYDLHPENYIIGMLVAKAYLLNNMIANADTLLTKLQILPFEGAVIGRQLYHEAKLKQAVTAIQNKQFEKALSLIAAAKLWPSNLGVGKPYDAEIDERLELWLNYICYTHLNNKKAAEDALKSIVQFTPRVDNTILNFIPANHLVTAWAIEKLSSSMNATSWLQKQLDKYPTNKSVKWSMQVYKKQLITPLSNEEIDGEIRILQDVLNFKN